MIIGVIGSIFAFKVLLVALLLINPLKYLIMYKQRLIRKEFEEANKKLIAPQTVLHEAKEI